MSIRAMLTPSSGTLRHSHELARAELHELEVRVTHVVRQFVSAVPQTNVYPIGSDGAADATVSPLLGAVACPYGQGSPEIAILEFE